MVYNQGQLGLPPRTPCAAFKRRGSQAKIKALHGGVRQEKVSRRRCRSLPHGGFPNDL